MWALPFQVDPKARAAVLEYIRDLNRPITIGEVSLELGWRLPETEALVEDLVREEILRPLTDRELRSFDLKQAFIRCMTKK